MAIAEEHKIPCAMFSIFPAAMVAFAGPKHQNPAHPRTITEDYMVQPPWIPFPSNVAFRRRHQAEWIAASFRPNASGVSDADRFWETEHTCCCLIIHRSCPEAEPHLFPLLTELFAKPAVPAGVLTPPDVVDDDVVYISSNQSFLPVTLWLDEQPERSVIYIELGNEAPLTAGHACELAHGLELAGVARCAHNGFHSCVCWAHRATGGFMIHCGWGSIFESPRFALPLVMLPLFADPGLGVQALPAREMGVEVAWNNDGLFHRNAIAAAVREVMLEEKGKAFARKAKELHDVLGNKERQEMYLDDLVGYL